MRKLTFIRAIVPALLLATAVLAGPSPASAQISVGISVHVGPPALPVYTQPPCPTEGYLWTPGYWAYGPVGYFWVPGVWVAPPRVGLLWTPGYWGFAGGLYGWHAGYWGPHVGFYGGINYGFGYTGVGFAGGEWRGGAFFYNRAVMNVDVNIRNVYSRTVIVNNVHTSFNGEGGIVARPTPQELAYGHEQHMAALSTQVEHERAASQNRALFASENHGRPAITATNRPGDFSGHNDVARNEASNHDMARSENRDGANREQGSAREDSNHNSKPSKQEKQAQKRQAKAEQKNNREER